MTQEPTTASPTGTVAPEAMSSMFQAVAGLRNGRAAAAMLGCFVTAWLVIALVGAIGGRSIGGSVLAGLVAFVIGFSGIHASGVLLMDQARGVPGRSIMDAVMYGLLCVPKTIALIVALIVVAVGVYLAIALVFYVSKIPGLGLLLFAVAFPVSVLAAGLTFTALTLGFLLSLAAIWEGASISGALVKTLSVLRHRLVETVLLTVIVMVLAGIVGMFVFGILMTGIWPAAGLALSVLGVSVGEMQGLLSIFGGSSFNQGDGGYAVAGFFGAGVLFSLAMTLALQVYLMGVNLMYLRVSEGLDSTVAAGELQARFDGARRKAAELGQKAREAADRARAQAEKAAATRRSDAAAVAAQAASLAAAPGAAPVTTHDASAMPAGCPACGAGVTKDDLFCGSCGHKLG